MARSNPRLMRSGDDRRNGETQSLSRDGHITRSLRAVSLLWLFVGMVTVVPVTADATDRPHPTLIDPAATRCTVCHTTVSTTHEAEPLRTRTCLDCHGFNDTLDGTHLTATAGPGPMVRRDETTDGAADVTDVAEAAADRAPEPESSETPAAPGRTGPPPVAVAAPTSTATADRIGTDALPSGSHSDRTRQLYMDGRRAYNRGRFDEAFDTWRVMLVGNPDAWVLQVEIDSLLTSAQSTLARFGDHDLYVVMKDDLHYVLSGVFGSEDEAAAALRELPQPLRVGGAFPIQARQILGTR